MHQSETSHTISIEDLINFAQLSGRLDDLLQMIKQFFKEDSKIELANLLLKNSHYSFDQVVSFLKRVGFDMDLCSHSARTRPAELAPDQDTQFRDLFDIYSVARGANSEISKAQLF